MKTILILATLTALASATPPPAVPDKPGTITRDASGRIPSVTSRYGTGTITRDATGKTTSTTSRYGTGTITRDATGKTTSTTSRYGPPPKTVTPKK